MRPRHDGSAGRACRAQPLAGSAAATGAALARTWPAGGRHRPSLPERQLARTIEQPLDRPFRPPVDVGRVGARRLRGNEHRSPELKRACTVPDQEAASEVPFISGRPIAPIVREVDECLMTRRQRRVEARRRQVLTEAPRQEPDPCRKSTGPATQHRHRSSLGHRRGDEAAAKVAATPVTMRCRISVILGLDRANCLAQARETGSGVAPGNSRMPRRNAENANCTAAAIEQVSKGSSGATMRRLRVLRSRRGPTRAGPANPETARRQQQQGRSEQGLQAERAEHPAMATRQQALSRRVAAGDHAERDDLNAHEHRDTGDHEGVHVE